MEADQDSVRSSEYQPCILRVELQVFLLSDLCSSESEFQSPQDAKKNPVDIPSQPWTSHFLQQHLPSGVDM